MVTDLRKKFVVVTTTLMLVTFGTFLIVNDIYNTYWYRSDTAYMLDLIADSGFFFYGDDSGVELTIKNITDGVSPIAGMVVDEEGNIISEKVIGDSKNRLDIPNTVIRRILAADDVNYQMDRYLYSLRRYEDGRSLIVIMDTSMDDNIGKKLLGAAIIIISGVAILVLITFYLSKFVTDPAQKALLREKRFISDAGHELKTPLGAISINAQALQAAEPDNLYAKNIVTESERMGRLIERLLTLSKLDEGRETPKARLSLSDLAMEMALTYESVAFEKSISYDYSIDEDIFINGNDDEIRQLFAILIDNAIKNAGENGFIEIACISNDGKAQMEVRNSGSGISPEDLPHIFDRFYTSDKSRSNKSFGLGLAIAKAIVQGHGGEISVSSSPDEVTVFKAVFKAD